VWRECSHNQPSAPSSGCCSPPAVAKSHILTIIVYRMVREQPFDLIYDSEVWNHLRSIERKYHSLIRSTIAEQLTFEPNVETTNRKPLERPITL
jgi:hypothetical protein